MIAKISSFFEVSAMIAILILLAAIQVYLAWLYYFGSCENLAKISFSQLPARCIKELINTNQAGG